MVYPKPMQCLLAGPTGASTPLVRTVGQNAKGSGAKSLFCFCMKHAEMVRNGTIDFWRVSVIHVI